MIVPMKKVSLLMMDKNKDAALERLRELGVVHLEKKSASSPALNKLMDRHTRLEIASGVLAAFTPKKGSKVEPPEFDGDIAGHVVALSERRKKLQDYMFNHQREKSSFEKWGEFEPRDFKFLANNGVPVYLYEITLESYEKNTGDVPLIVLATDKKNNAVRLLAFDKIPSETPFTLPERPLSVVNERNLIRKTEVVKIEAELASLSSLKNQLDDEKSANLADIEFETARAGMELIDESAKSGVSDNSGTADLSVSWISGYAPVSDIGLLKRAANENNWALCAADPAEDDTEVPTKLKNNRLTNLIYPLTDFLEMYPGYRETDVSGWFLLFFTLFFGMIFGDAAYGTVLFLISLICIAKTAKKGVPLIFKFLFLMSVSNIIWGTLTCAWFGLDAAKVPQVLQNISLPLIVNVSGEAGWLSAYNANNFWIQAGLTPLYTSIDEMSKSITSNLMLFCFSIALLQLSIAHIKGIIGNIRSPKVLAEFGQIGMLVGMYFVVLSLVVFNTGFGGVKPWQFYSLAGGFGLVFVFGNYEGSVLKSLLTSCANILSNVLGITNVFSDIMSYIRLWAVGLAGASIATTVDGFAGSMLSHFIFFVFGVVLFVFGHGFNMVLNVLSVLVHGVRLNTLEFSSHLGLNWSGFAYKPFGKR
ncbi:MAG: V-type ATP synthase subunit I [Spirochaetaceae bacterium]|jgi:V/A-type H+-transporting ATPase subunit I|nr:V-type ATP synthase subunit I [Spirochaetaceae bacterium]